jgi:hypothetical protein
MDSLVKGHIQMARVYLVCFVLTSSQQGERRDSLALLRNTYGSFLQKKGLVSNHD